MNDETGYVNYQDEDRESDLVPIVDMDTLDRGAWERIFYSLPQDEMEIVVCLLLGLNSEETAKVLQFKNMGEFYNTNAKLKESWIKQKARLFEL